jgi:hypothetical protein
MADVKSSINGHTSSSSGSATSVMLPGCTVVDIPLRSPTQDEIRRAVEDIERMPPYEPHALSEWTYLFFCALLRRKPFARRFVADIGSLKRIIWKPATQGKVAP